MKQGLLALLLIMASWPVLAQDMSAREAKCYHRIKNEADFILSRINLIHREYENQVKHSGLARFKSGSYSTSQLLDNTIRKYHRRLVHQIRNYPIRYATRLRQGQHLQHPTCLASSLQDESVGTIHEFELSWQKALRQARNNARYFKQLNGMR